MIFELKNIAWCSALIIPEHNPDHIRQDACGAWIVYEDYNNRDSMFGWEIDHIYPVSRLRCLGVPVVLWDNPLNIRALHWRNNLSKGNEYPIYTSVVTDEGATNVSCEFTYLVNEALQDELRSLFKVDK